MATLHHQILITRDQWATGRDLLRTAMRRAVAHRAVVGGLDVADVETWEYVRIRQTAEGRWVSAGPEDHTHLRITLEREIT